MKITKKELIEIIQISKEAIEEVLGPVELTRDTCHGYRYQVLISLINNLIPKDIGMKLNEEKGIWEEE